MYKTKVVMYGMCAVIPVGTKLNLSNSRDVFCVENCELIFDRLFVESHPEIFEKVEDKSLAEWVLMRAIGFTGQEKFDSIIGFPVKDIVKVMQEYHKIAGGWTDEDMIDFCVNAFDGATIFHKLTKETVMEVLALYKQKRGIK